MDSRLCETQGGSVTLTVRSTRVPFDDVSIESRMSGRKHAQPTVGDQDSAGLIRDRTHRRSCCYLEAKQNVVTRRRGFEDVKLLATLCKPLTNQRHRRFVAVDELLEGSHDA